MSLLKRKDSYLTINILGKSRKLNINYIGNNNIKLIEKNNEFHLLLPKEYKNKDNIDIINLSIKNLYNKIATKEIENAMELIRHILKFAPSDYLVKRLPNDFYKASKDIIVVNPDIVQYSREIINTTIIQAFCKTKYRSNSIKYKELLQSSLSQYENRFNELVKVS